ncbi:transcription antitermination factor NusB [Pseudobacter ginsenosidimutans]|uniref:NusB antitermination factor n=1 Tax=Pseudobacter ginsenosidimutans TaxID=661488 RepID=A0A4Q7MGQ3_9BACT|nr:transcription antitermination factor NusB [Pseudobacter ginsenosidimutans]QEC45329.1 transcription antitermination factor NusB [Pseudobacter ginsenosidimutans]RZS65599.1 NusB antitermination factor [Pseudobacter ginsenosidimutans]
MISRRNIRVKVMQTLYAVETQFAESGEDKKLTTAEQVKILQKQFDQSQQLFVFMVHFLTELARYAETDARNRAAKHLPSAQDLSVNTKLAGNEVLWKILESPSWLQAKKEAKPSSITDQDMVKKIYLELVEKPEYKEYIAVQGRDKKQEKEILEFIFTQLMLSNERFDSYVEEYFSNWDDDGDMLSQLLMTFLSKPANFNFQELLGNEKWYFAKSLLETTVEKKELTMEYIRPKLKNWDADRIAVLDMLLMRMGVCEFLFFETIPPKVTINEYIDLAKEYSTPQSGQFVNGILDNIHKDLVRDNKMRKVAFSPNPNNKQS